MKQTSTSITGRNSWADDINYMVGTFRGLFPERRLNAQIIRQRVIANHLKGESEGSPGVCGT